MCGDATAFGVAGVRSKPIPPASHRRWNGAVPGVALETEVETMKAAMAMTNRRHFLVAAASSLCAGAAHAAAPRASATHGSWIPSAKFLEELPELMSLAGLPGLSIAVLDRGTLAWQRTFG